MSEYSNINTASSEIRTAPPDEASRMISIEQVFPAENYPLPDQNKLCSELVSSIREHGLIEPIVVYEQSPEHYTIISGHVRYQSCLMLGFTELPCKICPCESAEDAALKMVDALLCRRDGFKCSELSRIASLALDACKHQGIPSDEGRSNQVVAKKMGITVSQLKSYIRLQNLHKSLLELVDDKRISLSAGSIVSELPPRYQKHIHSVLYHDKKAHLTASAAKSAVTAFRSNELTMAGLDGLLQNHSEDEKKTVSLKFDVSTLSHYVDMSGEPSEIALRLLHLLEEHIFLIKDEEKEDS